MAIRDAGQQDQLKSETLDGKPWWKSSWLKASAGVAAFSLLLTNINSILLDARALPSEIQKTSDQFFNWYGDYPAWKGYWTNFPEGFVDMAEMNLSKEGFRINVDDSSGGDIVGSIETQGICEKATYFDQLIFDGKISSSRNAEIEVFDHVGGFRRNFAKLRLIRNNDIMTVVPLDDPAKLFSGEARIARAPLDLIGSDSYEALCRGKQSQFIRNSIKKFQQQSPAREVSK